MGQAPCALRPPRPPRPALCDTVHLDIPEPVPLEATRPGAILLRMGESTAQLQIEVARLRALAAIGGVSLQEVLSVCTISTNGPDIELCRRPFGGGTYGCLHEARLYGRDVVVKIPREPDADFLREALIHGFLWSALNATAPGVAIVPRPLGFGRMVIGFRGGKPFLDGPSLVPLPWAVANRDGAEANRDGAEANRDGAEANRDGAEAFVMERAGRSLWHVISYPRHAPGVSGQQASSMPSSSLHTSSALSRATRSFFMVTSRHPTSCWHPVQRAPSHFKPPVVTGWCLHSTGCFVTWAFRD